MENFLLQGFFNAKRVAEFEAYVKALPDDSGAPKMRLEEVIENIKEEQKKIAMIDAQAQMMRQRAQQFLMEDPDGQASQIADAQMALQQQEQIPIE